MHDHVAHHFDNARQQHTAAELGMWAFLASEVLFFGGLFTGYAQYRHWYPQAFAEGSGHLDLLLGCVNTAILLTSSLTMALAVHAAQGGVKRAACRFLLITISLGALFLGIKAYEYYSEIYKGKFPGAGVQWEGAGHMADRAELFFSFYFGMTGLHAAHMIVGVAMLSWLAVGTARGRRLGEAATPIEMTGLYWHFVDVIWVFLFPLLYLIR